MDKKCILLGAGASFGYDQTLLENERPPLGRDLLLRAVETGVLQKWKYPNLFFALVEYASQFHKDEKTFSDIDVEEFLEHIAQELQNINATIAATVPVPDPSRVELLKKSYARDFPESWKSIAGEYDASTDPVSKERTFANTLQMSLGESWYMTFELFKHYSISYRPNYDAYQRLALYHFKEKYSLISLNYDVIFELAAIASGMLVRYPEQRDPAMTFNDRKVIDIAKVHGSINWFNSYENGINLGDTKERGYSLLHKMAGLIYSNRIQAQPLLFVHPLLLSQIGLKEILISGSKYYEPALLPPIGGYKDYEKVKYFVSNWNTAANMIKEASELVLIGTSLRRQDTKLRETLSQNVSKQVRVTIVGSKSTETEIKSLLVDKIQDIVFHENFETYARTL